MKGILFRATESAATVASCLVIFGGAASAQTISNTGPDSTNIIRSSNECSFTLRNDNDVNIVNNNPQTAVSGDSSGSENTTVGSVNSGNASNNSSADFNVVISNDTAGCVPPQQPTPVTPTEVTPEAAPTVQPLGGRGGEAPAAQAAQAAQVVVPKGGVGAGAGGQAYLFGLIGVTTASSAWAAVRLGRFGRHLQEVK
jgi:hypothetical protein